MDYRGYHPYYYVDDSAPNGGDGDGGHRPPLFKRPSFRPIEFRRRVLAVPWSEGVGGRDDLGSARQEKKFTSPYLKLMQEAMKSRSEEVVSGRGTA